MVNTLVGVYARSCDAAALCSCDIMAALSKYAKQRIVCLRKGASVTASPSTYPLVKQDTRKNNIVFGHS